MCYNFCLAVLASIERTIKIYTVKEGFEITMETEFYYDFVFDSLSLSRLTTTQFSYTYSLFRVLAVELFFWNLKPGMDVDVMPKMSAIEKLEATIAGQGFDPSTWIQKPTSAKTPDVSHVLSDVFGYERWTLSHLIRSC